MALAAICTGLLAPLGPMAGEAATTLGNGRQAPVNTGILAGQNRPDTGESGQSAGCWARGVWYAEGAVIDLKALKGVQSLSVTPVHFVCRDGAWVSVSAEK